jgi:hypothetical protein
MCSVNMRVSFMFIPMAAWGAFPLTEGNVSRTASLASRSSDPSPPTSEPAMYRVHLCDPNLQPNSTWGQSTMPIIGMSADTTFAIFDVASRDVALLSDLGYVRRHNVDEPPVYDGEDLLRVMPTFQNSLRKQLVAARIAPAFYPSRYPSRVAPPDSVEPCRRRAAKLAGTTPPADIRPWLVALVSLARSHTRMVIGTRPITTVEQAALAEKKLRAAHVEVWNYRQSYWRLR